VQQLPKRTVLCCIVIAPRLLNTVFQVQNVWVVECGSDQQQGRDKIMETADSVGIKLFVLAALKEH
jgi:hypothetical protein